MPPILIVQRSCTTSHSRNGAVWEQMRAITDKDVLKKQLSLNLLLMCASDVSACFFFYDCVWWSSTAYYINLIDEPMSAVDFSWQMCFPGNQAKSILHDWQHRPLRACRPVEDRIRSLPMTGISGVWAKRICRAVIGKRSKAKSVLGGDFFLFVIFFFLVAQKEKVNSICKR